MKKKVLACALLVYGLAAAGSMTIYSEQQSQVNVRDVGRLLPTMVKEVRSVQDSYELQEWMKNTSDTISIAGMQHSQGGQTMYPGAVMLDMKGYNKILHLDRKQKKITVQSGATWRDIQNAVNPYGLSVQVMQSQNIFTVGGSLSVNVHGRDITYGSLIDTVDSFRLLRADGTVINVSRSENSELFPLVIGGYGLFGVILDVSLNLADDELYQLRTAQMDYDEYSDYFNGKVKSKSDVRMHIARLSVAPDTFLKEMYATDYVLYRDQSKREKYCKLREKEDIVLPKMMLGLSRYSDWGKNTLWETQRDYFMKKDGKLQTRNNVMRSDSAFMEYENGNKTELLQEYFVPFDNYAAYVDDLRALLEKEELNLLNISVRYVGHDEDAVLSYAKDDMFALVLLINQGRSKEDIKKTEKVVRKMIDVTLAHDGSYYLPYYQYPSQEQLEEAYPRAQEFFQAKRKYDPEERFQNLFYKRYGK
ncbi:FAD-binding protein [Fictibacillus aquaticus]|uniref:FAD-binding oxidoreductase n=1 Tax=Fictibacillus aquaticus TaxID=2021314 RepID=A0A235FD79_9BACL|nr:FAD-binding oxidoreductase [Fictibacillus aquaticus]OYD59350.1 FAD-binding oxidoreductase [Fictibacillus aquaticus]